MQTVLLVLAMNTMPVINEGLSLQSREAANIQIAKVPDIVIRMPWLKKESEC